MQTIKIIKIKKDKSQYRDNARMINECGTVGGMRFGRDNKVQIIRDFMWE
jgi:hypothetical protein